MREAEPWEKSLTELLNRWYTMPFAAEPNRSTDNLNRAAENNGLLAPGSVRRLSWDTGGCIKSWLNDSAQLL